MLYLMTSGCYSQYGIGQLIEAPEGLTSEDFKGYEAEEQTLYDQAFAIRDAERDAWLRSQGWTAGWGALDYAKQHELFMYCYDHFSAGVEIDLSPALKARGWKELDYVEVHETHPVTEEN